MAFCALRRPRLIKVPFRLEFFNSIKTNTRTSIGDNRKSTPSLEQTSEEGGSEQRAQKATIISSRLCLRSRG